MKKNICKNCKYYQEPDEISGLEYGDCRRYPPSIEWGNVEVERFPFVNTDDWCGEYKRKPRK